MSESSTENTLLFCSSSLYLNYFCVITLNCCNVNFSLPHLNRCNNVFWIKMRSCLKLLSTEIFILWLGPDFSKIIVSTISNPSESFPSAKS